MFDETVQPCGDRDSYTGNCLLCGGMMAFMPVANQRARVLKRRAYVDMFVHGVDFKAVDNLVFS